MPEFFSLPDTAGGSPSLLIVLFGLAFLESCAFIGLFISGIFLLSSATLLYATGFFPLWQIVLPAFTGALLGDHAGFAIGRLGGTELRQREFISRHSERISKVEAFLLKSAPWAIVIGRLSPATRSLTPFIAGLSRIDRMSFHYLDLLACSIWAAGLAGLTASLSAIAG